MSETKIQIYDENSLAECRICLENGEAALITPCNCRGSQKYVHLECLNKWRVENINNEKYTNCEICKRKYNIRRFFKSEIFLYDDKPHIKFKSLIYIFILYFLAGVIWTMDFETNFKTIDISSLNPIPFHISCRNVMFKSGYKKGLALVRDWV